MNAPGGTHVASIPSYTLAFTMHLALSQASQPLFRGTSFITVRRNVRSQGYAISQPPPPPIRHNLTNHLPGYSEEIIVQLSKRRTLFKHAQDQSSYYDV
jgi:hypothetical protein